MQSQMQFASKRFMIYLIYEHWIISSMAILWFKISEGVEKNKNKILSVRHESEVEEFGLEAVFVLLSDFKIFYVKSL